MELKKRLAPVVKVSKQEGIPSFCKNRIRDITAQQIEGSPVKDAGKVNLAGIAQTGWTYQAFQPAQGGRIKQQQERPGGDFLRAAHAHQAPGERLHDFSRS